MSQKKYNNYSKKPNVDVEETPTVELDTVSFEDETVEEKPVAVVEEVETVEEKTTLVGYVNGCTKLNVRKKPNPNSEVLCVIAKGAEVSVDVKNSTNGWYKVYTENGLEGYCMMQYITVA